jgi:anti-anti-sigma regulatory factor
MLSELSPADPKPDPAPLRTEVRCDDPARPCIAMTGDLYGLNGRRLHKAVIDVLRRLRPCHLDLDLQAVTSLDAIGIGALLLCEADARQLDCPITLRDPPPDVRRELQTAGVLQLFTARQHLARPPESHDKTAACG